MKVLPGTGKRHPPNKKMVIGHFCGFPINWIFFKGIHEEQVEWSRDEMVVSYSAITGDHVRVQGFGCNPHIVEEEEDDLEVVNEVAVDDDEVVEVDDGEEEGPGSPVSPGTMRRRRKAAKRKS